MEQWHENKRGIGIPFCHCDINHTTLYDTCFTTLFLYIMIYRRPYVRESIIVVIELLHYAASVQSESTSVSTISWWSCWMCGQSLRPTALKHKSCFLCLFYFIFVLNRHMILVKSGDLKRCPVLTQYVPLRCLRLCVIHTDRRGSWQPLKGFILILVAGAPTEILGPMKHSNFGPLMGPC